MTWVLTIAVAGSLAGSATAPSADSKGNRVQVLHGQVVVAASVRSPEYAARVGGAWAPAVVLEAASRLCRQPVAPVSSSGGPLQAGRLTEVPEVEQGGVSQQLSPAPGVLRSTILVAQLWAPD